jgi:hypothetical protein
MPDIFGAPVGIMSVDQDRRDQAVTMMNLASGAQKLELGQMELQKQRSIMQQLAQRQKVGPSDDGRASLPGATTPDLAHDMFDVAGIAMNAGDFEYADKLATTGTKLMEGTAKIQKETFDTNIKRLNTMSNLMDGVYDQATWQKANAEYQAMTGEPSPYAKYQFNPDLVEKIKVGVVSAKDKAYITKQGADVALDRVRAAKDLHDINKIDAETQKIRDQDKLLLKNGVKPPTNMELEPVSDMISAEYGKAVTKEQARTLARPIYDRSKELMNEEGLSSSQAVNRAFEEAKLSGGLKNLQPEKKPKDQAASIIEDLRGQIAGARAARGTGRGVDKLIHRLPITGAGGFVRRLDETIAQNLWDSDEDSAKQFRSSLQTLRTMAPKLITGSARSAKDEREMTKDIVPGLEPGASETSTLKALDKLDALLHGTLGTDQEPGRTGQTPAQKAQDDKFQTGVTYRNSKGQQATYLGNGKWQEIP